MKFSANISVLYTELPFLDRIAAAGRDGFDAVECWFPYETPATQVWEALQSAGLCMISINTAPGDVAAGEFGLALRTAHTDRFEASIRQALDYAQAINCPRVHVLAGMLQPQDSATDAQACYVQNLCWAITQAQKVHVQLLIEPLNATDRPGYLLNTQAQARQVLAEVNSPHLKLMFDAYHVAMTEGLDAVLQELQTQAPHIGHIQFADVPGRGEPGTGRMDWQAVFAAMRDAPHLRWGGFVGAEYKPSVPTGQSLAWMRSDY